MLFSTRSLAEWLAFLPGRCVRVDEWLALPISDHQVLGLNPTGGEIQPMTVRRFTAQSPSLSPFHRLDTTKTMLKGT